MGYQIIIVGDKDHPEVIGINGWCDNTAIVTKDGTDLKDIPSRVCIVAQTTERLTNYEKVVDIVSKTAKNWLNLIPYVMPRKKDKKVLRSYQKKLI